MQMSQKKRQHPTYWQLIWKQFSRHRLGMLGVIIVSFFILVGIYAPFFASSKPFVVQFQGQWYFPFFRYLFYTEYYTKPLDIFYNLLIVTFPLLLFAIIAFRHHKQKRFWSLFGIILIQFILFFYFILFPFHDPAIDIESNRQYQLKLQESLHALQKSPFFFSPHPISWKDELESLNGYAQLNLVLKDQRMEQQHVRLEKAEKEYDAFMLRRERKNALFPSLWNLNLLQEQKEMENQQEIIDKLKPEYHQAKLMMIAISKSCQVSKESFLASLPPWVICDFLNKLSGSDRKAFINSKSIVDRYENAEAELNYLKDKRRWLEVQKKEIKWQLMPLLRHVHWEEDVGGDQNLNQYVSWWDLSRINRKDMVAGLIFGIRVSLSVGFLAVGISLLIGVPIGAVAGYYGGKFDLFLYRLIEIWESMPTFFMLLMIVAFLQSKSIFLIIIVIGLFSWTRFSRFIRGEFFKQRELLYVESCLALGYSDKRIIFSHLLPNAIPPLLTLIPFAVMAAITSEAGLSFLGLGEEGSNSWGVLMDEGRQAFPAESDLLWPPAILLTILLVAIALVGDSMRDALDPKLQSR